MKRYKIQISQENSNEKNSVFLNRSKEEMIFQVILPDEEIDIKAVMKQIVAGKE